MGSLHLILSQLIMPHLYCCCCGQPSGSQDTRCLRLCASRRLSGVPTLALDGVVKMPGMIEATAGAWLAPRRQPHTMAGDNHITTSRHGLSAPSSLPHPLWEPDSCKLPPAAPPYHPRPPARTPTPPLLPCRWEPDSYGYHGDDGKKFGGSAKGEEYGPKFTKGDTIGAAYNLAKQEIFFT